MPPDDTNVPLPDEGAPEDEPTASAVALTPVVARTNKRGSLRRLHRELEPDDLKAEGAQKIIIEDWERAEDRCAELEKYVDLYHDANTRAAVLSAEINTGAAMEVLYSVALAAGSVLLGAGFAANGKLEPDKALICVVGGVLIVIAAIAKLWKRK